MYNLPDQSAIRTACQKLVGKFDVIHCYVSSFNTQTFRLKYQFISRTFNFTHVLGSLGNPESDHVIVTSDLESVLTYFCKCREVKFVSTNGWTNVLQIMLVLDLPRAELYNMFYALTTKYIAT